MTIPKDTLWKAIIEDLFEDFCHYFFPDWAKNVADFSKKPEFLDKELDEIYPQDKPSKRFADKLVKVFTKEGEAQWILIHIEVQGYKDPHFPARMFTYFHRIRDRYATMDLMTLAILTDTDRTFKPDTYTYQYRKTKVIYLFEIFKLIEKSEQELNVPNNPFSIVMLAAKKALEKKNLEDVVQLTWKRELIVQLKKAHYSEVVIRHLLHFIKNYVVFEEPTSKREFEQFVSTTFNQRKSMGIEEVVLMYERKEAREEGREEGRIEVTIKGIQKALQKGKLDLTEIAELFDVSVAFVQQVQRGEVK